MVIFVRSTGGFDRFEQIAVAAFFGMLAALALAAAAISPLALGVATMLVLFGLVAAAAAHARPAASA
jgi:Na+-translocating ferredoxin:NAD+ oxidoreductase RnfE subunit